MGKTHDRLMQAEANYQKEQSRPDSIEDFETKLMRLGLNKKKIQKKNISELLRGLILLNEWIVKLDKVFRKDPEQKLYRSSKKINMKIVSILSDLRKSALERYSALINKQKIENIKTHLSLIADKKLRREIETNLLQIELKDQIILRELHKSDQIFQKYRS
jgi:hypothetical protein